MRHRWVFFGRNCRQTSSDFHSVWSHDPYIMILLSLISSLTLTYLYLRKVEVNSLLTSVFSHACKCRQSKPIPQQLCWQFSLIIYKKSVPFQTGRALMWHSSPSSDHKITMIQKGTDVVEVSPNSMYFQKVLSRVYRTRVFMKVCLLIARKPVKILKESNNLFCQKSFFWTWY